MIRTDGLTKRFPGVKNQPEVLAVDSLALDIPQGEVFGFLGPNGAGKTTTVRMLTSLIGPTAGKAEVNGYRLGENDAALRASVGVLTESPGLYDRLTAEQNLTLYARLHQVNDPAGQVRKYLEMLDLWDRRDQAAGSYSKGMKQKLAIARALLHEPKTLFLDEPTAGLDPAAAKTVRDFINELRSAGRTIFICTHNLDEAERLCDRVAIFRQQLLVLDTPANLRRQARVVDTVLVQLAQPAPDLVSVASQLPFVEQATLVDHQLVVDMRDPMANNPALVGALVGAGAAIQLITQQQATLEQAYLHWIGEHEPTPEPEETA